MTIHAQIKATMELPVTVAAVSRLEKVITGLDLTPQQQLAVIALLAARQLSVLPEDALVSAGDMFGELVEIGMKL